MDTQRQDLEKQLLDLVRDFPRIDINLKEGVYDKSSGEARQGFRYSSDRAGLVLYTGSLDEWAGSIEKARAHFQSERERRTWEETSPNWCNALWAKIQNIKNPL